MLEKLKVYIKKRKLERNVRENWLKIYLKEIDLSDVEKTFGASEGEVLHTAVRLGLDGSKDVFNKRVNEIVINEFFEPYECNPDNELYKRGYNVNGLEIARIKENYATKIQPNWKRDGWKRPTNKEYYTVIRELWMSTKGDIKAIYNELKRQKMPLTALTIVLYAARLNLPGANEVKDYINKEKILI